MLPLVFSRKGEHQADLAKVSLLPKNAEEKLVVCAALAGGQGNIPRVYRISNPSLRPIIDRQTSDLFSSLAPNFLLVRQHRHNRMTMTCPPQYPHLPNHILKKN